MLSLNTHISLDAIKSNKKLQEIECENSFNEERVCGYGYTEWTGNWFFRKEPSNKIPSGYMGHIIAAPTIADVIDNAEMLFGFNTGDYVGCIENSKYGIISHEILTMCQDDKPLADIEKYILKNIK